MKVGKREKESFFKTRCVENQHISSRFTARFDTILSWVSNEKKVQGFRDATGGVQYVWGDVATLMELYFSLNCFGLRANIWGVVDSVWAISHFIMLALSDCRWKDSNYESKQYYII